jgi:anti-sigma regulatory factor (Ser/Thr protein kinase)
VTTLDQFEITAHPRNAGLARDRVRQTAQGAGLSDVEIADIEIAVGEAVTNAILYGSPSGTSRIVISVMLHSHDQSFHVEVRDQGRGFNPEHIRDEIDTDMLGGRGIRLMRALMDEVTLHYTGSGMTVRLTRRREPRI